MFPTMNITKWVLLYLGRLYKLCQLSNVDKMKNGLNTRLLFTVFSWVDQFPPAVFILSDFCVVPYKTVCVCNILSERDRKANADLVQVVNAFQKHIAFSEIGFVCHGINYLKSNCLVTVMNKASNFSTLVKTCGPLLQSFISKRSE